VQELLNASREREPFQGFLVLNLLIPTCTIWLSLKHDHIDKFVWRRGEHREKTGHIITMHTKNFIEATFKNLPQIQI